MFRRLKVHLFPEAGPSRGLHHMQGKGRFRNHRFHLRVEPDGSLVLVIDAARVLHMNRTAAEYAYHLLRGESRDETVRYFRRRYRAKRDLILTDRNRVARTIESIARSENVCPISYLDVTRIDPFSARLSAPLRMDLALTYRCQNACRHCYVERDRNFKELVTGDWKRVIAKLHDIGVPHIVFTGGEATERDDLPELVRCCERFQIVSGLLTNGRRLADLEYAKCLRAAGLDHVQITLESHTKEIHEKMVGAAGFDETVRGIGNAKAVGLYTLTNTTICRHNEEGIEKTIGFASSLGVDAVACNSFIYTGKARHSLDGIPEKELPDILRRVSEAARKANKRFIWYTPTRYCECNPVELDLGPKTCSAGSVSMCVEPNGDVIPCQSYYESLGNVLKDPWTRIWNSERAVRLRERKDVPAECKECEDLALCGGGCPLLHEGKPVSCGDLYGTA